MPGRAGSSRPGMSKQSIFDAGRRTTSFHEKFPATCPYCGWGIEPGDVECPTRAIDEAADRLAVEQLVQQFKRRSA